MSLIRRSLSVSGLWGSPVHQTPHAVITLTIHYDQQLHTAIIQYFSCKIVQHCFHLSVELLILYVLLIGPWKHFGKCPVQFPYLFNPWPESH